MVRVAHQRIGPDAIVALHGEEDVATLHAPKEAIEIAIHRVVSGPLGRVGQLGSGIGAEMKTQRAVLG
jgi:methylglyoxal synthase